MDGSKHNLILTYFDHYDYKCSNCETNDAKYVTVTVQLNDLNKLVACIYAEIYLIAEHNIHTQAQR